MNKDKTEQIWYLYKNSIEMLNENCVDLLSKCYFMLGQKPEVDQIVMMAKFLVEDLSKRYGSMTLDEVQFAFEKGIRESEHGGFVNVRNWNIWLKEHKAKAQLQRQQRLVTDFQKHQQGQKMIDATINKAKRLK